MFKSLTPANIDLSDKPFRVVNRDYDDIYFSTEDAVGESLHHYIDANNLPQRFANCTQTHFTVGELGFGTGLNAFLTIDAFRKHRSSRLKKLYYLTTELNPISADDLQRIHQQLAQAGQALDAFSDFSDALLAHYPPAVSGVHHVCLGEDIELILLWGDSLERLRNQQASVDAWYLDGFAPSKNPEQWTLSLCREIARLSRAGTTLSAFSCARVIKDSLSEAGATLTKRKGFGRKREMLTGSFAHSPVIDVDVIAHPQWAAVSNPTEDQAVSEHVTIIGAGLAGALTAHTLAMHGMRVTVLTSQADFNAILPRAALHLHLSTAENLKRDIDLTAYRLAVQTYQQIDDDFSVGLLEFDTPERQAQLLAQPCHQQVLHKDIATGATHYPNAGAIQPQRVIAHCLQGSLAHENIDVRFAHNVTDIDTKRKRLHIEADGEAFYQNYTQLILCTGALTQKLLPMVAHISKPIRGQLSRFKTDVVLPSAVLCHQTLQVTSDKSEYFAGGTYDLHDPRAVIKSEDNATNLHAVTAHCHEHANDVLLDAWAGLRLSSNDTLPFVSPLPDVHAYVNDYAHLQHHATRPVTTPARYIDGMFINAGYGSKGTLYAPIAAKVIAHYLLGAPAPLPAKHMAGLHLGRFVIRHISRRTVETLFH